MSLLTRAEGAHVCITVQPDLKAVDTFLFSLSSVKNGDFQMQFNLSLKTNKPKTLGDVEMALQIRALTTLPEVLNLVSGNNMVITTISMESSDVIEDRDSVLTYIK